VIKLPSFYKRLALLCLVAALATACSDADKASINALLDARDKAISQRDASAYSALLLADYQDGKQTKVAVMARMINLFDRFQQIEMHSRDRDIRILDRNHAQCQQSYVLKVKAQGTWRTLVQRESLGFTRSAGGWRISSGL
jgi:hypothetical protein